MHKFYSLLFLLTILNSCNNNENILFSCLGEDYRRVLKLSEMEFKSKLKAKYKSEKDTRNLVLYLSDFINEDVVVMAPSSHLRSQVDRGSAIRDIWNFDRTPNLKGDFFTCLSTSGTQFLRAYCNRV